MQHTVDSIKHKYAIIGNDYKLNLAIDNAIKSAPTNLSVLVTGESGVGKDIFARLIHELSDRRQRRLVAVNCGAIPEGTIESELFGHVKGSFTGADRDRKGYFKEADGGTIFLDEVGELPLPVQVKLLRVLQNGEIIPVGESKAQKVDVRVVAATNSNLEQAIRAGHFRPDLYYRLNQMAINIPPLRERQEDIPMLFSRFAADIAEESGMRAIVLANDEAREYLMRYPWYGNVRELRTITQRIAWLETERLITREILERYLPSTNQSMVPMVVGATSPSGNTISDRELLLKALSMGQMITEMRQELFDLRQTVEQLKQGTNAAPTSAVIQSSSVPTIMNTPQHIAPSIEQPRDLRMYSSSNDDGAYTPVHDVDSVTSIDETNSSSMPLSLIERERQAIVEALRLHHGNRKLAARDLGVSERTLYRRIKDYDL